MPASVHRTLADGMTILGLPRKPDNANTNLHRDVEAFFMPASVHRTLADGMTILGLPRKPGNVNTNLHITVEVFFMSACISVPFVI